MTPEEIAAHIDAEIAKLQPRVDAAIARLDAEIEQSRRRVAELEFEKLVAQNARLGGVIPSAATLLVPDVAKLFEMREGALVVRNGETMPGDPLMPLTFEAWLEEKRKQLPLLFVKK